MGVPHARNDGPKSPPDTAGSIGHVDRPGRECGVGGLRRERRHQFGRRRFDGVGHRLWAGQHGRGRDQRGNVCAGRDRCWRHRLRRHIAASTANSAVAATSQATSASAVAASSAAPAAGVVTINHLDWWQPNTPVLVTFFNGNKADFEAKYPNVKVNYLFAPSSTDVRQKWIVMATGGTPPDTSQVATLFIRDLVRGQLAEPLDAYIAKTPDMAMSNFVGSGLFSNQANGHVYGIPFDGPQILIIAYNTDHFQEAGIDPSKSFTWKWTTEQFLDTANKLNRTQGGKTVRGGMQPFGIEPRAYSGWLYANGGDFYNPDNTKTLINSPQGRNALQLAQDMWLR